jgi:hypothetical protein
VYLPRTTPPAPVRNSAVLAPSVLGRMNSPTGPARPSGHPRRSRQLSQSSRIFRYRPYFCLYVSAVEHICLPMSHWPFAYVHSEKAPPGFSFWDGTHDLNTQTSRQRSLVVLLVSNSRPMRLSSLYWLSSELSWPSGDNDHQN